MAQKCDICQRGSTKGARRSHSKVKTLKRQHINLQSRKIGDVKIKVCTSCLRTLTKNERAETKK
jgi:ribosomal protein L28